MQAQSDKRLVERVLAKERAAFDEFFAAYFGRLVRFCRTRVRDEQAVEDIVQETLVKAINNLHGYRGEALLYTWLCGICRNQISDWYSKNAKRLSHDVSIDDDPNVLAALESLGISLQDNLSERIAVKDMVTLALDHLPERYGRALEMKYLEGLSVREVAQQLNIGRLAAQSLLSRARAAFKAGFLELVQETGHYPDKGRYR